MAVRPLPPSLLGMNYTPPSCEERAGGALPKGESSRLYSDFLGDLTSGDVRETPLSIELEAEFAKVLRQCLFHAPPLFVRTNDALHPAAARLAGELEFVSADIRERDCATHLGFKVLP
jgi:hypothetical protein